MAGSRTLKLSILGDVDNLNKSLKSATTDVETFGDKVGKVGKMVGAAFVAAAAAAGAYAVKIGIDGVKAAIADEKAQTQLALALQNATGATTAQIAATEQSILKMSLATGVADDALRPALGRLARSTGDITKAQGLLTTALDISTATGKPLETVANALGKAYDGNTAALGKLGIGLSAAELKTMSFEQVQGRLTDLFGGAASKNAETYSGRIARMQIAFDEAKETIGFALLPILERVINFINNNALPAINAFSKAFSLDANGLGGTITTVGNIITSVFTPIINGMVRAFGYVKTAIGDNLDAFKEFGGYISTYLAPIIGTVLGGALTVAGKIAAGVIDVIGGVISAINKVINTAIDGINFLIRAYNAIPFLGNTSELGKLQAPTAGFATGGAPSAISGGGSSGLSGVLSGLGSVQSGLASATAAAGGGGSSASSVQKALNALTAQRDDLIIKAEILKTQMGLVQPSPLANFRASESASGSVININVSGAIDREGTARTIADTLNNSFYRGTGGATNLVTS